MSRRIAVVAAIVVFALAAALLVAILRARADPLRGDLLITAGRVFDGNRLAGRQTGVANLGTLVPGAPADLVGMLGDPFKDMQTLEQPQLVVAAGVVLLDNGNPTQAILRGL